ncbi:MAG: OmpH family outer membrane protein [Roseinatronobacter sp.]
MRRRLAHGLAFLPALVCATALHAQAPGLLGLSLGVAVTDTPAGQTALRTLDDDRFFRQSLFGQRVAGEIERASRALEAENDRLLAELTAREDELTDLRAQMTVEDFRAAATAFDIEAERIRRDQAEKRQRLVQFEEAERRRFFALSTPILREALDISGGQVLIDARAIIIGLPEIEITDLAVDIMDDTVGDGTPPPFPLTLD